MSMFLLLPIGLAALASLLLPLLVHLARRSEQRVVPFAALRWLRALPQPRRKHRFEELLLLLLRLLLLAALALLIAQPVLFGRPDRRPWVAVAPGADLAAARALRIDGDASWHWLAPGFPELGDGKQTGHEPSAGDSLASLLRELDAQLPAGAPLTVVVPAIVDGADAQRPLLSRKIDWRVLPATRGHAAAPPHAATMAPFALQVRHAPDRAASLRYLRAAAVAWNRSGTTDDLSAVRAAGSPIAIASASQPVDLRTRNLAWLAPGEVPPGIRDWVADGSRILLDAGARWPGFPDDAPIAWADPHGPLARAIRVGNGRVTRLERPLLPASMPGLLEADFPSRLRALFADAPPAPARVGAAQYAPRTGMAAYPERPRPLAPWLAWLVAGLFLCERIVASGRRRSEAA